MKTLKERWKAVLDQDIVATGIAENLDRKEVLKDVRECVEQLKKVGLKKWFEGNDHSTKALEKVIDEWIGT